MSATIIDSSLRRYPARTGNGLPTLVRFAAPLWGALVGCASHSVIVGSTQSTLARDGVPNTNVLTTDGRDAPGLKADGSIVVAADGSAPGFAMSAPLTACTPKLYDFRGTDYPVGSAEMARAVDGVVISFDSLLAECAADDPSITLPKAGKPLSEAEKATNFRQVGECAYRVFPIKGYWIPKLLIDIDVCDRALGTGWHMPTEAETVRITHDQATVLFRPPQSPSLGNANTLSIFVRTEARGLAVADLGSNSPLKIVSKDELDYKSHREGHTAVRCIRSLEVTSPPPRVRPMDCSGWGKGKPDEVAGLGTTEARAKAPDFAAFERLVGNDADSFEQQAKRAEADGFESGLVLQTESMKAAKADVRAMTASGQVSPATPSFRDMRNSPNLKRIASTAARLRRGVRKVLNVINLSFAYCRNHPGVPKCDSQALTNYGRQSHSLEQALSELEQIPPTPEGITEEFEQIASIEADTIELRVRELDGAPIKDALSISTNGLSGPLLRVALAKQSCLRWGEPYNWVPPTFAHPGNSLALKRILEALKQVDQRAVQHIAILQRKIEAIQRKIDLCEAPLATADCPPDDKARWEDDLAKWEEMVKSFRLLRDEITRRLRS